MNILITGAQLGNKGAESMLYITVDQLKKHFPGSIIYFGTTENYDITKYRFIKLALSNEYIQIALGGSKTLFAYFICILKDIKKILRRKNSALGHYNDLKKTISKIDLVVDISGFSIGIQWSRQAHERYLNQIKLARKNNIPVYLMPQSFGPFSYADDMKDLRKDMGEILRYPQIIFAREDEGYHALLNTFGLDNVRRSTDLVLQNNGLDWRNVFIRQPVLDIPVVNCDRVVGIIPNKQCFVHGSKDYNLEVYRAVIAKLINLKFKIVIFRHSKEDLEICRMIKSMYESEVNVMLEEKEFSCLEYDEYVKQFSLIICSRYHGIVHAYRNGIPCIALGWAIKYKELTKCVGQEKYCFDITDKKTSIDLITSAVAEMEKELAINSGIIKEHVKEIQKDNCFDQIMLGTGRKV